jgi:HEAT repeat protein
VSGYRDTRVATVEAAGTLRVPETVPRLLALLQDPDAGVALRAVEALARIGDPGAVAGLNHAAVDPRRSVADAAAEALKGLPRDEASSVTRDAVATPLPDGDGVQALPSAGPGTPEALSSLLALSRGGDHRATVRLTGFPGAEVETELTRALREELPQYCYWNYWGDYEEGEAGSERQAWDDGWFTQVARRLGQAAVPILISRLTEVAEGDLPSRHSLTEGPCVSAAVTAAHCLREGGATESIPALVEVAASHPEPKARDVAAWSVVALRRQDAQADEPWFPEPDGRPLAERLGPGGPWLLVQARVARLDADPEAELVVTYRETEPEAAETAITRIAALEWTGGGYRCASSQECLVSRVSALEVRDIDGDGLSEVALSGADGRFPMLAVYGWRDGGLALLSRFEGFKAPQLMADLDADGIVEVLSGTESERDPEHPHDPADEWNRHAAHWDVYRWHSGMGRYDQACGPQTLALLSAGLTHSDDLVRAACAEALGRLRAGTAASRLLRLLQDPQPRPRHAAAWALGNLRSRTALPALRHVATSDPDEPTRETAGLAVARLDYRD